MFNLSLDACTTLHIHGLIYTYVIQSDNEKLSSAPWNEQPVLSIKWEMLSLDETLDVGTIKHYKGALC